MKIRAQQNYEGGKRAPNAEYILRLHEAGVDILFVLTGKRTPKAAPELPRLHSHDKTISATTAEAILKLIIPGKQKDADWYPGTDMPFVVSNVGNAQDGLNMVVFVCIDASLPEHVVARPVFLEVANVQPPVMLPRSRFRFSPGDAAVAAMGLKDAVTRVIKLRNQQQSTSLDA
nr:hypothetical protein [Pseudohongiella sp.]